MMRIPVAAAVLALATPCLAETPKASPSPAGHAGHEMKASPAAPAATTAERRPSQRETVTTLLGGKKVVVEYGRPALHGRPMSELLTQLPADRMWRAGENQVTTFTSETDVMIGGKRVPAGKYTVYVHAPATGDYSLVLNKDLGVPLKTIFAAAPPNLANEPWPRLQDYAVVKEMEVLRVPLRKAMAKEAMDRFLIGLDPAKDGVSAITLTWGDQSWTTDLRVVPVPR